MQNVTQYYNMHKGLSCICPLLAMHAYAGVNIRLEADPFSDFLSTNFMEVIQDTNPIGSLLNKTPITKGGLANITQKKRGPLTTISVIVVACTVCYAITLYSKRLQGAKLMFEKEFSNGIRFYSSCTMNTTPILGRIIGAATPIGIFAGSTAVLWVSKHYFRSNLIKYLRKRYGHTTNTDNPAVIIQELQGSKKITALEFAIYGYIVNQMENIDMSYLCYTIAGALTVAAAAYNLFPHRSNITVIIPGLRTFSISGPESFIRPITIMFAAQHGIVSIYNVYQLYKYHNKENKEDQDHEDAGIRMAWVFGLFPNGMWCTGLKSFYSEADQS